MPGEPMVEYVRHHRCYNADPNVSIADWDRGVAAIEREAVAQALTPERLASMVLTVNAHTFRIGRYLPTDPAPEYACQCGWIGADFIAHRNAAILAALRDEP